MGMIAGARDLGFRVGGEFLEATQNSQADHRRHIAKHCAPRFGDGARRRLANPTAQPRKNPQVKPALTSL
jgi:hypothetical protein